MHEMERLSHLCHNLKLIASMPASSVLHPKHSNDATTAGGSFGDNVDANAEITVDTNDTNVNEYVYQIVPAFQLFVRSSSSQRTAFLVIRGTADISDAMLDAAAVPVQLEVPGEDDQMESDNSNQVDQESTNGTSGISASNVSDTTDSNVSGDSTSDASSKGYRVLKRAKKSSLKKPVKEYWAHQGMNFAAW